MDDLVGERNFETYGNEFPLLIKFIDASDWLSIQVHPDDALAASRGIGNGKTEMWYILDAEPGAELITGFNRKLDRELYLESVENNTLREILNVEKVANGDVYYIPSGRVHALGPGILLAEIQQTSDTTYRIYDWDRVDAQGNSRELHSELALDAIDFGFHESYRTNYPRTRNQTVPVVESPYFTTRILDFNEPIRKDYSSLDSFVLQVCVSGSAQVHWENGLVTLTTGEVILLPATLDSVFLVPEPNCKILEVYNG
jgi:mannose-6-phosphate isomerase